MPAATQEMLTEARAALHRLMTGAAVAEFRDQNGETIRYSQANRNALISYVKWLESELGVSGPASSGPMRAWF